MKSPGPRQCTCSGSVTRAHNLSDANQAQAAHSFIRVTATARPMASPKYSTPPWSSPYRVLTSGRGAPTRPYWRTGRVYGPDRAIGLPAGSRSGHMGYRPGPDRAIWATGRA